VAKNAFQLHAVDAKGEIVVARKLTPAGVAFFAELPRCLVATEAWSSAHHCGRALVELGHEVRQLPPRTARSWFPAAAWIALMSFVKGSDAPSRLRPASGRSDCGR
jgi:transposase